jgi:hypothetical protein
MTTIQQVFMEHDNWLRYVNAHKNILTPYQIEEVDRMLHCRDPANGFWMYYCHKCDNYITMHNSCNSRLCTHCGKRYVDQWANKLRKRLFFLPSSTPPCCIYTSRAIEGDNTQ